ncbi:PilN domain-containing protein [Ostreibacterium oceani]|uniref:General secretion pathway protein L n=1 Tax=Ostreibacterium oceani TaxID=2654998 RepID=A0A6N7EUS3_9GAMM|nr:PilN domain-containing protein [Ostreibacterium oceani]MPV85723.1 hypothetical protein [Ostreibacterium oceani]
MFADDASKASASIIRRTTQALQYWGDALVSVLPEAVKSNLIVGEEQLIVDVQSDRITIVDNQHGELVNLGAFERQAEYFDNDVVTLLKAKMNPDSELVLRVANETVLSKPLDFPVSIADNLNQTVWYEIEKHTPFDKNSIYFDTKIERKNEERLFARLFIVHQSQVQMLIDAFAQAGILFDKLCTIDETNINLLPVASRRKQSFFRFNKNWLLIGVLCLLVAILFAVPAAFKRLSAIKLNERVLQLQAGAEGEALLWQQRDEAEQVMTSFLASRPIAFATLYEALARQLPDDTWVNDFIYDGKQVKIKGESLDAAGLVATINASPLFTNGQILSPIVRARQSGKDRFYIGFDVIQAQ